MENLDEAIREIETEINTLESVKRQLLGIYKSEITPGHQDIADAIRSVSAAIGTNQVKLREAQLLNEL